MHLQEEYIKRHNLIVPIIKHVSRGSLLFKGGLNYGLLIIEWKESNRHPGNYFISYYVPLHDGYMSGRFFQRLNESDVELEWDNYTQWLVNWCNKITPVTGDKEIVLAIWEIFVYCCDGWLAEFAQPFLEKLLFKSLDKELSIDDRFVGYQECLVYFTTEHPSIMKAFRNEVLPHINNYSHWLGKLAEWTKNGTSI
jgi:hypothetical protein